MQPCNALMDRKDAYCLGKTGDIYTVYLFDGGTAIIDVGGSGGSYTISYHDPVSGNRVQGEAAVVTENGQLRLTAPSATKGKDWIVLLQS